MSFKNAIKLVFSRFGMVWAKFASVLVTTVFIVSLCVEPVLELYAWLDKMGFVGKITGVWSAFITSGNFVEFLNSLLLLFNRFSHYYVSQPEILWEFTIKLGFLLLILYKFSGASVFVDVCTCAIAPIVINKDASNKVNFLIVKF